MTDIINIEGDGVTGVPEVETEYEDDGEEEAPAYVRRCGVPPGGSHLEEPAQEVEEEEEAEALEEDVPPPPRERCGSAVSGGTASGAASVADSGDYAVPEGNREVWKQFGTNTEAGRMLRRLYGGSMGSGASKVSYPRLPSPSTRWEHQPAPRKPCPQRTAVKVPRPNRISQLDREDPRNWHVPMGGRRPAHEILAEMESAKPERPNLPRGRDQNTEKQGLQDNFTYCGGKMMPEGAMGYVPKSEMPKAAPNKAKERRQIDENGMTAEQREIFEELTLAVKYKQERIAEIDAEQKRDPKPSKAKTDRNKEALQLRNDIQECLANIDKLLELTE
eukprot:TRINITY_DN13476_c0_g1_i1.p1 TRINITY_DN13476_c0_g1~~TRINITY_DN13476_c0_g1_i1.p1  ORF type:complete len:333 (-),score=82.60 TRINITY_DN13476_c0_g1_i1:42-1040(-)